MELQIAFSAVYLKSGDGYVGFVEELPGLNSYGHSIDEARAMLYSLTALVFDEERRHAEDLIEGREVVRESFNLAIPGR